MSIQVKWMKEKNNSLSSALHSESVLSNKYCNFWLSLINLMGELKTQLNRRTWTWHQFGLVVDRRQSCAAVTASIFSGFSFLIFCTWLMLCSTTRALVRLNCWCWVIRPCIQLAFQWIPKTLEELWGRLSAPCPETRTASSSLALYVFKQELSNGYNPPFILCFFSASPIQRRQTLTHQWQWTTVKAADVTVWNGCSKTLQYVSRRRQGQNHRARN